MAEEQWLVSPKELTPSEATRLETGKYYLKRARRVLLEPHKESKEELMLLWRTIWVANETNTIQIGFPGATTKGVCHRNLTLYRHCYYSIQHILSAQSLSFPGYSHTPLNIRILYNEFFNYILHFHCWIVTFMCPDKNTQQEAQQWRKEGFVVAHSSKAYRHDGKMAAGAWGNWLHCASSQEAEGDNAKCSTHFLLDEAGLQLNQPCHPHLEWVFPHFN